MRTKRTIPGSIYKPSNQNTLVLKFKGRKIHTGLKEGKVGRQLAEQLLMKMWREYIGLDEIQPKKKPTINEAFERFMAAKMNLLDSTKKTYIIMFKAIFKRDYLIDEQRIEEDIQNYLKSTTNKSVTINNYLERAETFIGYCSENEWIRKMNIFKRYKQRNTDAKIKMYTDEELQKIVDYFATSDIEMSLMIRFMIETGARIVDVLTLQSDQINENIITWQNKVSKRDEERPISDKALEILKLLPQKGKIFSWNHSEGSMLNNRLRKAFKDIGIERNERAFQEFRSTFRMKLVKRGIPEPYIQYLMRHKSISTTIKHYTSYEKKESLKYLNSEELSDQNPTK